MFFIGTCRVILCVFTHHLSLLLELMSLHFFLFILISSMLVVATSGTGFVLGSGTAMDLSGLCWTCAGTMMVAASANSLNQVCS